MRLASIGRDGWIVLAVLTVARAAYGLQLQSVGAVGPAIVDGLGVTYASLGTLVGAYTSLGVVLALPVGWLTERLGDRRIVLGGFTLMVAGSLVMAAAPGFGAALAGRVISGAGGVLLGISLPTIIMNRFAGPALSLAMGTLLAGWPVGIGVGAAGLPLLGSWRIAMLATAGLCALSMAGTACVLDGAARRGGRSSRPTVAELKPVVAAGLVWACVNAGYSVLLGFAAVFFVGRGLSPDAAGGLVSLTAFATVPTGPIGGWLLGRHPIAGIAAGTIIFAVAVALLPWSGWPATLLVISGVALATIGGPIVALPAAVLTPAHRAIGMSVFWLMFFVLMTVLPPLAGLARDLTGAAGAPLLVAAAFSALALPFLAAYVATRRQALLRAGNAEQA